MCAKLLATCKIIVVDLKISDVNCKKFKLKYSVNREHAYFYLDCVNFTRCVYNIEYNNCLNFLLP